MRRLLGWSLALVVAAAVVSLVSAAEDGKALFETKCAMCHGKDGVAKKMAEGSRNFNDPEFQKATSAEAIAELTASGKNKMPGYKDKLSAEQIKAIAEYIKTIK